MQNNNGLLHFVASLKITYLHQSKSAIILFTDLMYRRGPHSSMWSQFFLDEKKCSLIWHINFMTWTWCKSLGGSLVPTELRTSEHIFVIESFQLDIKRYFRNINTYRRHNFGRQQSQGVLLHALLFSVFFDFHSSYTYCQWRRWNHGL